MKILELLLPKGITDKSISKKHATRIDALQKRMDSYVDKISDPGTSAKGREFLKAKLKTDYDALRDVIKTVSESVDSPWIVGRDLPMDDIINDFNELMASNTNQEKLPEVKYEVYDRKTGSKAAGPFSTLSRARAAVDRLDNKYGGYRYGHRPVKALNEAVHKLPLTDADFDLVRKLMDRPIPAVVAPIYISEIIDDDEFTNLLQEFEETNPAADMRPHIVDWMKRVMPDQMHRFYGGQTTQQREGTTSVIHGYDPHMYHGSNDPITGDAFGQR